MRPRRAKLLNGFLWLFDARRGPRDRLAPRWIFLRALGAIYFSAFYSLLFQVKGLIGPKGVLPAQQFLIAVAQQLGAERYWYAPSLYWISASSSMLMAVTWIGLLASVTAFLNLWPRLSFFICFICFLSFIGASSVFSSYQSDGMLLEAGFLALFFAPRGVLPGWGAADPPSRASRFLLQWEWFRIYFESGMVKLASGDPEWRNFTAMDQYYQNGPLPTWIGWYAEHLPHWFHAATVAGTLALELGLVFMMFFPRRVRLICFCIVTPWEIGVILTANYTFLNYLVLSLGFLLLDDKFLLRFIPTRLRPREQEPISKPERQQEHPLSNVAEGEAGVATAETEPCTNRLSRMDFLGRLASFLRPTRLSQNQSSCRPKPQSPSRRDQRGATTLHEIGKGYTISGFAVAVAAIMLTWIAYDTTVEMIGIAARRIPSALILPVAALEPFRIANQYGLFAVMTRNRYEIEFQGSDDGVNWIPYRFRNKPQALNEAPRIYAPYQPRFDWNLWFASLGDWRENEIVPITEERLLVGDADVIALFRNDPFPQMPPRYVRSVLWQYWFTSISEKRRTGDWWQRKYLGLYAPELTMTVDGKFAVVEWPQELPPHD